MPNVPQHHGEGRQVSVEQKRSGAQIGFASSPDSVRCKRHRARACSSTNRRMAEERLPLLEEGSVPCVRFTPQKRTCAVQPVMSALGHKQTCAAQKGMSALPLIATAKADIAHDSQ